MFGCALTLFCGNSVAWPSYAAIPGVQELLICALGEAYCMPVAVQSSGMSCGLLALQPVRLYVRPSVCLSATLKSYSLSGLLHFALLGPCGTGTAGESRGLHTPCSTGKGHQRC